MRTLIPCVDADTQATSTVDPPSRHYRMWLCGQMRGDDDLSATPKSRYPDVCGVFTVYFIYSPFDSRDGSIAPDAAEIFHRAVEEGERRRDQSLLELVETSSIAGFTIVFGIVALGIVHALVEPRFGDVAWIAGALVFSVEGVLPRGRADALSKAAEEIVHRRALAGFASAIIGVALVSLLSFLLEGVNSVSSRVTRAYIVGVVLILGPFDHVIVTALCVFFGILSGAAVSSGVLVEITIIVTLGNFVGGLGLVTLTRIAQTRGAKEPNE